LLENDHVGAIACRISPPRGAGSGARFVSICVEGIMIRYSWLRWLGESGGPRGGALRRWVGRAGIVVLAILATAGSADAAEARTAAAGAEIVIDTSDKLLVDKTTNARGKVTIDQAGKAPAVNRLVYKAPEDVSAEFTETVRYQKENVDIDVPVHVSASEKSPIQAIALGDAFKVLALMFVLAVLLEQALSVLFNWRPFLQFFNARGVKTIISVVVAWLILEAFKLDLMADLINLYSSTKIPSGSATKLLTALILAGGSSAVNNLLVALGFRSMRSAEQLAPKPPPDKAWLSVRLERKAAVGQVLVLIGPDGAAAPPVVGMIDGTSLNKLLRAFIVDHGRFPVVAGYHLTPDAGKSYVVQLEGKDKNGTKLTAKWEPHPIAAGAILDIVLEL
jgi:hypothetical protein